MSIVDDGARAATRNWLDRSLSVAVILVAIAFSLVLIHREFSSPIPGEGVRVSPQFEPMWREDLEVAVPLGSREPLVSIVEFADFECPVCAHADTLLGSIQAELPDEVSRFHVYFPLAQYRFSVQAALAAECGRERGRFGEIRNVIYGNRQMFGLKSWGDLAVEAGIPDTVAFVACMIEARHLDRVEAGRRIGEKLGVRGTPTLFINGWRFARVLSKEELYRFVQAGRDGEISDETSPQTVSAILGETQGVSRAKEAMQNKVDKVKGDEYIGRYGS